MDALTHWLTQAEIDELCAPLRQPAAQRRYLESLGLTVKPMHNGRPLVMRSNVEAVLGGLPQAKGRQPTPAQRPPVKPNEAGLRVAYSRG